MAPGVTFAARCIVAAAIGMTPIEEVQVPSLSDGAAGGAAQRDSFGFAVHRCHSRPGDRTAASISVHAALKYELAFEEAAGDPRNSISPASRRNVQHALTASGLTAGSHLAWRAR